MPWGKWAWCPRRHRKMSRCEDVRRMNNLSITSYELSPSHKTFWYSTASRNNLKEFTFFFLLTRWLSSSTWDVICIHNTNWIPIRIHFTYLTLQNSQHLQCQAATTGDGVSEWTSEGETGEPGLRANQGRGKLRKMLICWLFLGIRNIKKRQDIQRPTAKVDEEEEATS